MSITFDQPGNTSRQHYRELRNSLGAAEQQRHAARLAYHLYRHPLIRHTRRIACYLANDGEIGTGSIIETAWSRGQQVFLPVLSPLKNSLYFAPYTPRSVLCENRFGIDEPACSPREWKQARQIDIILLPLVAFDDSGNRLGMGGGFYDRTLAFMRHRAHRRKPLLLGLAHEIQRADKLNAASWDIPLDAIATENGLFVVNKLFLSD